MKRTFIALALAAALSASAAAQQYTYLRPPTLAVMDFEVSMTVFEKVDESFYGGLVAQALLSVLVQQNASARVEVPVDEARQEIIRPGEPVYSAAAPAPRGGYRTAPRMIFPPIFKIYDKKYVEHALQNNSFAVKDLYAKTAAAYAYADLDFLVLGNVYETSLDGRGGERDGLGINVRVLNTKRAEELYAYSAVIHKDLRDLPTACARLSQAIMRDILNHHCAQFAVREADELVTGERPASAAPASLEFSSIAGGAAGGPKSYDYGLFWQPRQVVLDDSTLAESRDVHKRPIERDLFYWALPGQYVVSVYNREVQQIKTIDLTLSPGDIRHVFIEKKHLESERGTVTLAGVLPSDTYKVELLPVAQRERYWWEIEVPKGSVDALSFTFDNGELSSEAKALGVEYRPATGELFIPGVQPANYNAIVTAQPPKGSSGVTGWWKASTRSTVRSAPLSVDLRAKKDIKLSIADFKLQARKALEAPKKNKITFVVNPGFDSEFILVVTDAQNDYWFYWKDNEKVTITSEYSQADWDAFPRVSYRLACSFGSRAGGEGRTVYKEYSFSKADLDPARDTVVVLELADLAEEWSRQVRIEEERKAAESSRFIKPVPQATPGYQATASTSAASAQPSASRVPATKAAAPGGPVKGMAGTSFGIGSATTTYYEQAGTTSYPYARSATDSSVDMSFGATAAWFLTPALSLGGGGYLHLAPGLDEMVVGFAAQLSVGILLPNGSTALLFDIGGGSGFAVGGGIAFLNPATRTGLSLKIGYMTQAMSDLDITIGSTDYPAKNDSFTVMVGYIGTF